MLLDRIVQNYINSDDFNGTSIFTLCEQTNMDESALRAVLRSLIERGSVSLTFESMGNPFIKAFPQLSTEEQVARLMTEEFACVYPTTEEVEKRIDLTGYQDRPFTRKLVLMEPQLDPYYFDLAVLDRYSSDPRCFFSFDDYRGTISIADQPDEVLTMP